MDTSTHEEYSTPKSAGELPTDAPNSADPQCVQVDWRNPAPEFLLYVTTGTALAAGAFPFSFAVVVLLVGVLTLSSSVVTVAWQCCLFGMVALFPLSFVAAFVVCTLTLLIRLVFRFSGGIRTAYLLAGLSGGLTGFLIPLAFLSLQMTASPTQRAISPPPEVLITFVVLVSLTSLYGQAGALWGARQALSSCGTLSEAYRGSTTIRFSTRMILEATVASSLALGLMKLLGLPLQFVLSVTFAWLPIQALSLWVLLKRDRRRFGQPKPLPE